jgi:GTPase SAR1 family protein
VSQAVQVGDRLLTGIQAFSAWKLSIATEIKRYRMWLHQQGLSTVDLDDKLARCLRAFTTDRILLAFVGEFSRGKTELINALLGRHFKSRLFPTRIGRTTMCPTEVFYDPQSSTPYIKLLPIQTRNSGTPLASYRRQLEHWAHLDIDLNSPQSMQRAFEEVAKTREVPTQVAESLGFEVEFLESSSKKEGYVHIPSWRHALINLDHPLLRLGLSIIDTPGLNALGLEPELTLSFLPDAHALLFVLSAECGVTASDFAIWNNHVRDLASRSNTALYAIINKIDLLEEEDVDYMPVNAEESLRRMCRLSARQLHLPDQNVMPLSAKQAMRAHIHGDAARLETSRIHDLELALASSVITAREQSLRNTTLKDVIEMVETSLQSLITQRDSLKEEHSIFNRNEKDVEVELVGLTRLVRRDQEKHSQRLVILQEGKGSLEQHLARISEVVGDDKLDWHFNRAREATKNTLNFGVATAVGIFFQGLKLDMRRLRDELDAAKQTVDRIYQRYYQEVGATQIQYADVNIDPFIDEFNELEKQAAPYKNRFGNLLASQEKVFDHFFETLAREAKNLYEKAREEALRWCKQSLAPLMQQTLEAKKRIDEQLQRLEHLQMIDATRDQRLVSIQHQLELLDDQEKFLIEISFRLQPVELV